ncbi:MAG: YfhO family protein [Saprospiraceae bacterium]|nr:YfhO family protein [Saprospiraceae bacterium]
MHRTQTRIGLLLLAAILIIVYPLSTMQMTLKWDAIDISLPWRYFVCDAFRNGVWPFWNPFQMHGFAQGTDPQTWYPIAALIGLVRGYDVICLNVEYLLHLIIAAIGFIRLSRYLKMETEVSSVVALCFCLSGFFVGNAQHLGWIIAGAWIPHLIASYGHFLTEQRWRQGLSTAIYAFMLSSGGYLAFTVIVGYFLVAWTIIHFLTIKKKGSFLLASLRLSILLLLSSGIILVSAEDLYHMLSRAQGLGSEGVLMGSSRMNHLLSLVYPAATIHETAAFWQADQSLINHYLSIPGLTFLLTSLYWIRSNQLVQRLWALMTLALILSWGEQLPVRAWLNALPGFDLFRFPSLFRYFAILSGGLLAAFSLQRIVKERGHQQWLRVLLVLSLICFGVGLFTARSGLGWNGLTSAFFTQSLAALAFLLSLYLTSILTTSTKRRLRLFGMLVVVDLFVFLQLNGPTSVYSEDTLDQVQEAMSALPRGYPHPPLGDPLISNADRTLQQSVLYRNTNTLYKRIGWDGYSPYQYQGFNQMEESNSYRTVLMCGPLIFAPLQQAAAGGEYFPAKPMLESTLSQLQITEFDPNTINLVTTTQHPQLLAYNQNWHPRWHAYVDGEPAHMHKAEHNLPAIHLPPGRHLVRFEFEPGILLNALCISLVIVSISLLLLLVSSPWRWPILGGTAILLVLMYIGRSNSHSLSDLNSMESSVILNEYDEAPPGQYLYRDRFLDRLDLDRLAQYQSNHPHAALVGEWPSTIETLLSDARVDSLVLSRCNFSAIALNWNGSLQHLSFDQSSNLFQDLTGQTYSATFAKQLSLAEEEIALTVSLRSRHARTAKLIISIESEGNEPNWTSFPLSDKEAVTPHWVSHTFVKDFEDGQKPRVKIYVWNPNGETLHVDDFIIRLQKK